MQGSLQVGEGGLWSGACVSLMHVNNIGTFASLLCYRLPAPFDTSQDSRIKAGKNCMCMYMRMCVQHV
jgi:hypothetical protein